MGEYYRATSLDYSSHATLMPAWAHVTPAYDWTVRKSVRIIPMQANVYPSVSYANGLILRNHNFGIYSLVLCFGHIVLPPESPTTVGYECCPVA